jgi:hypothetical protein
MLCEISRQIALVLVVANLSKFIFRFELGLTEHLGAMVLVLVNVLIYVLHSKTIYHWVFYGSYGNQHNRVEQ